MFEELPSPTPSLCNDDALAGVVSRPFAGLSSTQSLTHFAPNVALPAFAPAAPSAVHVPLSAVQQPPAAGSLQQLEQPLVAPAIGLLTNTQLHLLQQQLPDTDTLLQEFESVFGKVEQSHGGALTPPQSPPQSPPRSPPHHTHQYPINTNEVAFAYQPTQQPDYSGNLLVTIPQQQQQQQLIDLDEIVRSRVQAEEAWSSDSFAPPSPCTSSNSSFTSEEPTLASPESDDPDWVPEASPEGAPKAEAAPGKATAASRSKRGQGRRKPYGANVEDKRQRKKEQNKNAATRYRMKKKAEVEVIVGEENELKDKNDELQAKVADLSQEIRYLKNLMRDLFRARGLIK